MPDINKTKNFNGNPIYSTDSSIIAEKSTNWNSFEHGNVVEYVGYLMLIYNFFFNN